MSDGTLYRHRGCETPVLRYVGDEPLVAGMRVRTQDWQLQDGSRPQPGERMPNCPDCGEPVQLKSTWLEQCP